MKYILFSLIFVYDEIYFVSSVPIDPYRKVEHVAEFYGYPFEKHMIETEDGYFIEIHRIPGGKGEKVSQTLIDKPPVYLLHALTQSSADWISTGPKVSLAFLLADEGFDVWLGNCRGNFYGRKHKTYIETSYGFWNFSWHEPAVHDMPATIDMILNKTGKSQLYFGCFSQGCTTLLILGALKPEYNDKVRLAANMGPVAYTGHMLGLGGLILPVLTKFAGPILEKFGHFDITNMALITIIFTNWLKSRLMMTLIYEVLYAMVGPGAMSNNLEPMAMGAPFLLAGASTKMTLHYGLGVLNPNTFRPYDYGSAQNLIAYNSLVPPEYPIEKVTIPMVIFQGSNDYFADSLDVELLVEKLPNVVNRFTRPLNHFDFVFHRDIKSLVYNKIVELFQKSENATSRRRPPRFP